MSQEYEYFYEDEVYRFTKNGNLQLGMVLENAELVSSDEESDFDEDDRVTRGHIRVAWFPTGGELVLSEKKVHLLDRSLMPGDVVRRLIKGRDTQRGYCRQVKVKARVRLVLGSRQIISTVDSNDLTPLEEYTSDIAVCLGSWVGMVHHLKNRLLLKTKDGSTCYISDNDTSELQDVRDPREVDSEFRRYKHYPGQKLVGKAIHYDTAEWNEKTEAIEAKLASKTAKIITTVKEVELQQICVRWLCKALSMDSKKDTNPPKSIISGDDLKKAKLLNVFEPCTLQLGDLNFYTIQEKDQFISDAEYKHLSQSQTKNSKNLHTFFQNPIDLINGGEESSAATPKIVVNDFEGNCDEVFSSTQNITESELEAVDKISSNIDIARKRVSRTQNDLKNDTPRQSSLSSAASALASALTNLTTHTLASVRSTISSGGSLGEENTEGDQSVKDLTIRTTKGSEDISGVLDPSFLAKSVYENSQMNEAFLDSECDESNYADIDDSDDENYDDTASVSSSTSTSSFGNDGKKSKKRSQPALMTKMLKKKKLKASKKKRPVESSFARNVPRPKNGECHVVETLMTTSYADVVWQDGTIEKGIPSSQLYPIHHLDDQEFFPGDFVVRQKPTTVSSGEDFDPHHYGVVQRVDHAGRTTIIKWFRTYTAGAEPQPVFIVEEEVSVYDLKDHPDFRYRPGSVVIRVANFDNDQTSTIGQVLDNYPSGQVNVWWVDGGISFCFPQDLYKVGEYDSDEGELWDEGDASSVSSDDDILSDDESDKSWLTESEENEEMENEEVKSEAEGHCKGQHLKNRLVANIENARIAISRLEEIFTQNPSLQSTQVMKQLLECYKECRYMDKLMSTHFFHESNFAGLIEKIKQKGRASSNQKMAEQFNRLFTPCDPNKPHKIPKTNPVFDNNEEEDNVKPGEEESCNPEAVETTTTACMSQKTKTPPTKVSGGNLLKRLSDSEMVTPNHHNTLDSKSKRTNIKDSKSCNDIKSSVRKLSESDSAQNIAKNIAKQAAEGVPIEEILDEHSHTTSMCAVLCTMMKVQLLKTYDEVVSRYGGHFNMSNINSESTKPETDDKVEVNSVESAPERPTSFPSNLLDVLCKKLEVSKDILPSASEKDTSATESDIASPIKPSICESGTFEVLESAPDSHKFKLTMLQPSQPTTFYKTVKNEMKLLKTSLPAGIWVKGYQDRMDLYSVMIKGPSKTPYQDGLFFFDFQLSADYPHAPPLCNYIPYCSEKLNPNLYEDGKVCVSLLGTWSGKGTEVWTNKSNLLQVIISIQGLILVNEPYFNEAGYERQKGSQQGHENSRMYNEMVLLKLMQSTARILQQPPQVFKEEIMDHFNANGSSLIERLEQWLTMSEVHNTAHPLSPTTPNTYRSFVDDSRTQSLLPEFPLIPASKGFCLTLRNSLPQVKDVFDQMLDLGWSGCTKAPVTNTSSSSDSGILEGSSSSSSS